MIRSPGTIFLNGRFLQSSRAMVPIDDRGLLFGDGLFETFCAYNGRVYLLNRHLKRLRSSAGALNIHFPSDLESAGELIAELCKRNRLIGARVRITLTRGKFQGGLTLENDGGHTLFVSAAGLPRQQIDFEARRKSVWKAKLTNRRTGPLAAHKTISYMHCLAAQSEALLSGCDQAIMRDNKGRPVEGATANLFAVRGGGIFTPSVRQGCLPGVIRGRVIEIARRLGVPLGIKPLGVKGLSEADEVFMTNAVAYLVPVVRIDDRKIGNGGAGPIASMLRDVLLEEVSAATASR